MITQRHRQVPASSGNPDNEDYLLMIARHGSAWHMETLIAGG